jgi:hypothetical protein
MKMTDVAGLVSAAQENFSVLDAIKGRAYPEDTETIYLDTTAAYEIHKLEKTIADTVDREEADYLIGLVEDLKRRVVDTALTFRLRGISPGLTESITKEVKQRHEDVDFGPGALEANCAYLAAHIVDVTDSEGKVDSHKWSTDEVIVFRELCPPESFDKLADLMFKLSFAATFFDASVTPDFS